MAEKAVTSSEKSKKLELDYPCEWEYKLVTKDGEKLKDSISKKYSHRDYTLDFSNKSKKGNYESYSLKMTVNDEKDRVDTYNDLKKDENVKIII